MALTKLSITDEQVKFIKQKVAENVSGSKIAKMLKITQPKLWLNMEMLGLNKKKKCHQTAVTKKEKIFDWKDYKDSSLI